MLAPDWPLGYFTYYTSISGDPSRTRSKSFCLARRMPPAATFGDTHRHLVQKSVGFYAQDASKVTPRLTLNFGLRYEINGAWASATTVVQTTSPARVSKFFGQGIDRLYNVDYGASVPGRLRL